MLTAKKIFIYTTIHPVYNNIQVNSNEFILDVDVINEDQTRNIMNIGLLCFKFY